MRCCAVFPNHFRGIFVVWGFVFLLIETLAARADVPPRPFGDLYMEGLRMSRVNTYAGFGQVRGGVALWPVRAEFYGIVRGGMDSRTLGDPGDQIFNDNYVFAGAGVDLANLYRGIRLTSQVGYSWDLTSKIKREGFDLRGGLVTYNELEVSAAKLINEFYSESLYVHRYRNFIVNGQWRGFFRLLEHTWPGTATAGAGPLLWLSATADSYGHDFNRIAEARAGGRVALGIPGRGSMWIAPYYAWGVRWVRPTNLPNYRDFRLLMVAYFQI